MSIDPPSTKTTPHQPRLIANRYMVRERQRNILLGAVYRADDQLKDVSVSLALYEDLPKQAPPEAVEAFIDQLERLEGLPDTHLVVTLDVGQCPKTGLLYAARPWAEQISLATLLEQHGPMRPSVAARLVGQACRGMMAAHAADCYHADLRPENLLVEEVSGQAMVRIDGFGQARILLARAYLREQGRALGDPRWQPPEWIVESPCADAAADVWFLGACLYTALSGTRPEPMENTNDRGVSSDPYAGLETFPIQEQAPWVPRRTAEIVHGALLAMPASRCPSVDALFTELQSRTGGSLKLRMKMLQTPLSEEARQQRSARMEVATSWAALTASEEEPEHDALIGQVLGQRYKIVRLLGRGGMGSVYEAHDGPSRCAIKVVRPDRMEEGSDLVARFVREARANMAIDSPHVVQVRGADIDPNSDHLFIAMELLRGEDLAAHLKSKGPLDPQPAVALFIQACEGLAAAHAKGVIHRDIKPANIFFHETRNDEMIAKLVDFGIAKASLLATMGEAPDLTKTGGMLGSPLYMSPEQVRGAKRVTHQTDIWSVAAALYEALSGQRLWQDATHIGALALTICTTDPVPLQEHAPWISDGLAEVVHRGLKRNLAERWPSASAFADALRPHTNIVRVETRWVRPARRDGEGYGDLVSALDETAPTMIKTTPVGDRSPPTSSQPVVSPEPETPQVSEPQASIAPMAVWMVVAVGVIVLALVLGWWVLGRS
ncbi:MAG: serine/threonine-protein kinase [Myxococcota bacterium]